MKKYRARCNKNGCRRRRTIKGVFDTNDRHPCRVPGCTGTMNVDKTRERLGWRDSGASDLCLCDGLAMSIRNAPHRKGTKGCKHHGDMIIERSLKPRSKHSPLKDDDNDQQITF